MTKQSTGLFVTAALGAVLLIASFRLNKPMSKLSVPVYIAGWLCPVGLFLVARFEGRLSLLCRTSLPWGFLQQGFGPGRPVLFLHARLYRKILHSILSDVFRGVPLPDTLQGSWSGSRRRAKRASRHGPGLGGGHRGIVVLLSFPHPVSTDLRRISITALLRA